MRVHGVQQRTGCPDDSLTTPPVDWLTARICREGKNKQNSGSTPNAVKVAHTEGGGWGWGFKFFACHTGIEEKKGERFSSNFNQTKNVRKIERRVAGKSSDTSSPVSIPIAVVDLGGRKYPSAHPYDPLDQELRLLQN